MDLRAFEKFPALSPLLVRLHEGQRVYSLAKDKGPRAKAQLTGAVADLLGVELTPREHELLTDVLIGLMRQAEIDLKQALSERLSAMETVPLRLALHIANDDISVAGPMLRRSPVLTDLDLIYIIKSQGPDYWQAIAARSNLSPQLIDLLADTRDPWTAISLTQNDRVRLTGHALEILGEMAKKNEAIARPLLARPEVPESLARMLYDHVGVELKAYLRTYYGTLDEVLNETVDDVIFEFAEGSEFLPSSHMISAADKFAMLGMLNMQIIIETLQRGQIATFIAFFAKYTGLGVQRMHDFLKESCPKGLAISCRAYGVQKADFARIYLMTNRMRTKDRIVNQQDLMEILSYFDKVKPEVAARIVRRT